jgi:hypothetical protein
VGVEERPPLRARRAARALREFGFGPREEEPEEPPDDREEGRPSKGLIGRYDE